MKKLTLLFLSLILAGCTPNMRSVDDEIGKELLKIIIEEDLKEHEVSSTEIRWSGSGGGDQFSKRDDFTVEAPSVKEIADLIDRKIKTFSSIYGWSSHGLGRTGDYYLGLSFEEGGAQYYLDLILTKEGKDVRVLILYKGVQL